MSARDDDDDDDDDEIKAAMRFNRSLEDENKIKKSVAAPAGHSSLTTTSVSPLLSRAHRIVSSTYTFSNHPLPTGGSRNTHLNGLSNSYLAPMKSNAHLLSLAMFIAESTTKTLPFPLNTTSFASFLPITSMT